MKPPSRWQMEREYEQALAATNDPVLRGLITATYLRLRRGYVRVGDLKGHYLYDLGLTPKVLGGPDVSRQLPPVIRRSRRRAA
ncbi:hypothetical protein GO986_17245 [Deinococcus sp. HMF7620]|uniref:Uncharacterized protein n=1 Tax=Deinococcus arboris TaxID=2682977 RepID=A0A7C9I0N5_9DEIO|nr:hypothetical protein [Deinococcus arboris]MVN88490.1 hypothetical protein [Deinococcus arboris]